MLFRRLLIGSALSLLLSGCNAANVQPQPVGSVASETQSDGAAQPEQGDRPRAGAPAATAASAQQLSNQLDQLSGRLSLVQEQLIQLKTSGERQAELSRILLTRLQHLSESGAGTNAVEEGNSTALDASSAQIDAAIGQLMQAVNQIGLAGVGDTFAVASAYTAKGVWVLVRYRVDTGEAWLADQGNWVLLEEETALPVSSYAVQIQRADQDLKGYVAVRIDRRSGDSWWLNDRRWQVYR